MAKQDMKRYLGWALILAAMISLAVASGVGAWTQVATSTFTVTPYANTDDMEIVKIAHRNSSTGALTGTLPAFDAHWLYKVVTVPHATGTVTLTDNWDLYIKDAHGIDILGASGENRDQTTKEQAFPLVGSGQWEPVFMDGPHTFSTSGNAVPNISSETYLFLLKR